MKPAEISKLRMRNQQIASTDFKTVEEIVKWMCAMQAQDYLMAKWAIGIRLPDSTDKTIESAIDKGEIFRTHLLRPTWHFVSSDDIYWLLELTAPRIKSSQKARNKELELTEEILKKCNRIFKKILSGGNHLTREEVIKILGKAGIETDNNRASHILFEAELDGLICNGPVKGKKQTYALLNERVKHTSSLSREESLKKIALRYFTSHGPATIKDFIWWSGLPARDARQAIEIAGSALSDEKTESEVYYFSDNLTTSSNTQDSVYLLPAFDEFLISYRDRTPSLLLIHNKKAISDNGIFRPIIVINGQVAGLWKRTIIREKAYVETSLFKQPDKSIKNLIEQKAIEFGNFLNRDTTITHGVLK